MVTLEDVRELVADFPRSYEVVVHGRVKFRVGRIVYLDFSRDESIMGYAFPRDWRPVLVASDPSKFMLPIDSELRWNWVRVRLAAIERAELAELVFDAWEVVVPGAWLPRISSRSGCACGRQPVVGHQSHGCAAQPASPGEFRYSRAPVRGSSHTYTISPVTGS